MYHNIMFSRNKCPRCGINATVNSRNCNECKEKISRKKCVACDEYRPLIKRVCYRCRALREKKPILPKEGTFDFSLGYAVHRKHIL